MIEGKQVVVTGGAGFIGSNLCEALVNRGARVTCIDNLSTGFEENLESLKQNSNFTFVHADIRDDLSEFIQGAHIVYHQAALGSVPRSINDPVATNSVNVDGFLNILNLSRKAGVNRFVFASSSSVYGNSDKSPKRELELGVPLSPYAVSKLSNELYGKVFHDVYGMETIGLRYFNVFGPKQRPEGAYAAAIPRFVKRLLNSENPTVYGDGLQSRDFTFIENVIQANVLAGTTNNQKAFGGVYNIGCGEKCTVLDVIQAIRSSLSKQLNIATDDDIDFQSPRQGDIRESLADISAAQEAFGYEPKIRFSEGIERAIMWYQKSLT